MRLGGVVWRLVGWWWLVRGVQLSMFLLDAFPGGAMCNALFVGELL